MRTKIKKTSRFTATMLCMLVMGLLAMPSLSAQTPVTIDISTLGSYGINNSSKPIESQWSYAVGSTRYIQLTSANGSYTLVGTNSNLVMSVSSSATGANVIFDNVNSKNTATYAFAVSTDDVTLTLIGSNFLEGRDCISVSSSSGLTVGSSSGGSLTLKIPQVSSGINMNTLPGSSLIISGNAEVTVESSIRFASGGTIDVEANATLHVKSGLFPSAVVLTDITAINVNGILNVENTVYGGISGNMLAVTGTGLVSIKGETYGIDVSILELEDCNVIAEGVSDEAISTLNNIKMNNDAKLTIKTDIGEIHAFEASDPTSTYKWELTTATTTDALTNAVISVAVAAGQIGTIERKKANEITYTIIATAKGRGEINPNGFITVNHGDKLTFIFPPALCYCYPSALLVDSVNVPIPVDYTYTFENIVANHTIHVDFTEVGIDNYQLPITNYMIYPNPTKGQLTINREQLTIENTEYQIYSVFGQLAQQGNLHNNTIDVKPLANGMYFMKINNKVVKFVKN